MPPVVDQVVHRGFLAQVSVTLFGHFEQNTDKVSLDDSGASQDLGRRYSVLTVFFLIVASVPLPCLAR